MSTLELEHIKHASSSSNNFSVHSDGSLTLGSLQSLSVSGNTGIGTSSPSASHKLTLDHTSNYGGISLKQSGTQVGQIIQEGGTGNVYVDADSGSLGGSLILRTTGGTTRMTIDGSGLVTTPYQIGMNVAPLSGESGTYNNSANNNQFCIWTSIRWQVGNHYNTSNGTFTCPVAGKYHVSFHSNWWNSGAGTWIMIKVYKNGGVYEQWYHNTAGQGTWMNESGTTIVDCAANDTIRLYKQTNSGSGGGSDVGDYSSFVVRLLG